MPPKPSELKAANEWRRARVNLAGIMKTLDISQSELARRLKKQGVPVSQVALGRILDGRTLKPKKPTVRQLAVALGVSHSALCWGPSTGANAIKALRAAVQPDADLLPAKIIDGKWHHTGAAIEHVVHELRAPFTFQYMNDLQSALALWAGLTAGLSELPPSLRQAAQGIIQQIVQARSFQLSGPWQEGDQPDDWFERLDRADKDLFTMVEGIRALDRKKAGGSNGVA